MGTWALSAHFGGANSYEYIMISNKKLKKCSKQQGRRHPSITGRLNGILETV